MAESLKEQSLLSKQIADNTEKTKKSQGDLKSLTSYLNDLMTKFHGNAKLGGRFVRDLRAELETIIGRQTEQNEARETENKILKENTLEIEGAVDLAGKIGKKIKDSVESIPFIGEKLSEVLDLEDLGERMQKDVFSQVIKGFEADKTIEGSLGGPIKQIERAILKNIIFPLNKMGPTGKAAARMIHGAMKFALNPVTLGVAAIIAAFVGIFKIVTKIRKAARDLGQELGVSTKEARGLLVQVKLSEKAFNAIGLDGSKIKTTLGEIGKEFGSMENMTVANARNIERFAQNSGIAGSEVVKLNKVFMDLDGLSFDAATNVSRVAADLAKAANVNTAKVIQEMSGAAENFAKFSTMGAEGFAQAAVEAAKVGASLNGILSAADGLLKLESSISAQFEAQVLTGKQINLERARQLALDGDIAGLTTEIQSVVGQVGDIQSLNVIQRQSVADAIGISVQDLLRISRGEQVAGQETVLDEQKKTNKILADQYNVDLETLEVAKDKNVNVQSGLF
jgi:hypothetical protein